MTAAIETANRLAAAWAAVAWSVVWQSTLLVLIFALAARGLRRSSPGLRYWLWQIAAIKLLVMPLWSVSIAVPATPRPDRGVSAEASPAGRSGGEIGARTLDWRRTLAQDGTANGSPREERARWFSIAPVNWQALLLMGWALAVAGQVAAIMWQGVLLKRLLRQAAHADDPVLVALVAELSGRIGLRRPPQVLIAPCDGSPFVCGLRRPALVLPRGLAPSIDPQPLRSVLLHELAHIKRRDLLWGWIPTAARVLYFFHPAAHYIVSRALLERELACDQAAMVLAGQGAAGYASTLVDVVSRSSAPRALRAALASARLDGAGPLLVLGAAIDVTSTSSHPQNPREE